MKSTAPKRAYRMQARAEASAETERRIRQAAMRLLMGHDYSEVTLADVAAGAGVTLQTVLRKFGSKEGLLDAVFGEATRQVVAERTPQTPGDSASAIRALAASYERIGDGNWRILRQEHQFPALHDLLMAARRNHRAWLERSFAHALPSRGAARRRALDLLFVATDFYAWELPPL